MAEHREPWLELQYIRRKDGHTLASLAAASGIDKSTLSLLENGQREPNPYHTKTLAVALSVPVSVIEKRPLGGIYTREEIDAIQAALREGDEVPV